MADNSCRLGIRRISVVGCYTEAQIARLYVEQPLVTGPATNESADPGRIIRQMPPIGFRRAGYF